MSDLREHSEAAWRIASRYSHVLASETRDLAAAIDAELASLRAQLAQSEANHGQAVNYLQDQLASTRKALGEIADAVDPETMPGTHLAFKNRAELAFSALRNFRSKAKAVLTDEEGKS